MSTTYWRNLYYDMASMTWHYWILTVETKYHVEAADEVATRKRSNSLLKLALGLMSGIWAGS